jgi:hypothetical protein
MDKLIVKNLPSVACGNMQGPEGLLVFWPCGHDILPCNEAARSASVDMGRLSLAQVWKGLCPGSLCLCRYHARVTPRNDMLLYMEGRRLLCCGPL